MNISYILRTFALDLRRIQSKLLVAFCDVDDLYNMLSPEKQKEILKVLAKFGSVEGIKFDHYVTDWDFD